MAGRTPIQGTQVVPVEHVRDVYDYRFKNAVVAFFLEGFQVGFLQRHELSFRTRTHQSQTRLSEAESQAREFAIELFNKIRELNLSPEDIYNADQTAVFFELHPKRTIHETGVKTVWVKCGSKDKERVTVMLMGRMDGYKTDPWVVLKATPSKDPKTQRLNDEKQHGFGRVPWPQIAAIETEHKISVYGKKAGWWNGSIHREYLEHHFGDRNPQSPPKLLLLDHFSGHWTEEVVAYA